MEQYIFAGEPYVFRKWPQGFEALRKHLCNALELSNYQNVIVIGSAKLGFSLSPDSFGRQFSDESDIDVMVIDERLFDLVWKTLLRWNYPRRHYLAGFDWRWAKDRKEELYWGWFRPDKIRFSGLSFPDTLKPLRDISTRWFTAFRSISRVSGFASWEISGRLYRSWEHALLYHVDGLRQIAETIKPNKEG